jgi:hypothetical protein
MNLTYHALDLKSKTTPSPQLEGTKMKTKSLWLTNAVNVRQFSFNFFELTQLILAKDKIMN